jgi:hypothetical protein
MTTPAPDEQRWRTVLYEQARTAHALKVARAEAVLRNLAHRQAEMYARVELETRTEAEAAWRADVEAKTLWGAHSAHVLKAQQPHLAAPDDEPG